MADDEHVSRYHPVQEDMNLQRRVWRFERVGWYVLVIILLLGLAGLFGNGPLSDAQVMSEDGPWLAGAHLPTLPPSISCCC